MNSICPICGNTFDGSACLKCTQQSISVRTASQEALAGLSNNKDLSIQVTTQPPNSNTARLKLVGSTTEYAIAKPICRIGQDPTNDIVLGNDEAIAKFHTQIKLENDQYILRDLGTKEGTWLNGQQITPEADLFDGDYIKIGSYKFYFVSDLPSE